MTAAEADPTGIIAEQVKSGPPKKNTHKIYRHFSDNMILLFYRISPQNGGKVLSGSGLQGLTIKNNFMFAAVMMEEENCRKLLELALEFPIDFHL